MTKEKKVGVRGTVYLWDRGVAAISAVVSGEGVEIRVPDHTAFMTGEEFRKFWDAVDNLFRAG